MLIPCRFYIFGLHLLLLSHIAQSFVLTVDVEDLKKLAQKFVSESLADRLTNFVYRATKDMVDNNAKSSEEKDTIDAEDSHRISEENMMDTSYLRSGASKKPTQESNSKLESAEDKPREKHSVFKSNDDDVKHRKDEKVKSKYLEDDNPNSPSDKTKKLHKKTTKSAHYKRPISNNKADEGGKKHGTADMRPQKGESKQLKDENIDIEIPNNEYRHFTGVQRSQDLDGETTKRPELDMFDIKMYKKTDEDNASQLGNEGDVKWWEKELPRSQYFENFPTGRNVGPE